MARVEVIFFCPTCQEARAHLTFEAARYFQGDTPVRCAKCGTALVERTPPPSITCPRCGRTSYNLNDVRQRYCGACHSFHDDPPPEAPPEGDLDKP